MTGNLSTRFEARFLAHAAATALLDRRPDWTYGELARQASRAGARGGGRWRGAGVHTMTGNLYAHFEGELVELGMLPREATP